jgi:predicted esterase
MMNITGKEEKYQDISFRYFYINSSIDKKIIFFFHGFGGNRYFIKDSWIERITSMGYVLIILDAYEHGDRMSEEYKALDNIRKQQRIIDTEIQTAHDALTVYDYLIDKKVIAKEKPVTAMGVSMGAAVAIYLTTIFREVKTLVSIIGSPSFVEFYKYKQSVYRFPHDKEFEARLAKYELIDPLKNYHLLEDKHILLTVGLKDKIVPLDYAKALSKKIKTTYLEYDVGHDCPEEMAEDVFKFLENESK